MSHRDTCPDSWEARREGERAFNSGAGSWRNPHTEDCEEAATAWRRGYHAAEEERRVDQARQAQAEDEARMAEEAAAESEQQQSDQDGP